MLEFELLERRDESQRLGLERRRLTCALLLSLLMHVSLLSLVFGGQGLWLPGLGFPWQDRRIEEPDLRVVVVPAQVTAPEPAVPDAEPLEEAKVEQPAAARALALAPFVSSMPTPQQTAAAIVPEADPKAETNPKAEATPVPVAAPSAAPVPMPSRADQPDDTAPLPSPAPAVIAVERTDEPTWVVPATPPMPVPIIPEAPSAPSPEIAMPSHRDEQQEAARQDVAREETAWAENARVEAESQEAARVETARVEAARVEAARLEAARVEAARVEAARVEAARVEAARVEAARVESARVEAARVEAARVEAARVEAARVEAARVEPARGEAARVEAARVDAAQVEAARTEVARTEVARAEAARAEATRAEAARAEAARAEVARVEAERAAVAQEAAARREAALQAIGRQLNEEAARREAAARLPLSLSTARRYRLFGRADSNAEIILYAEGWARKIQLNMTLDMIREVAKQPHTHPVVTVAIRSDGSVESVTFVLSSGVPAIDEAIRQVVQGQVPYQPFPPNLAREYDVLEIRRTWHFDTAIRLY